MQNGKTANPAKTCLRSCRREKILRTRNCRRKFIKNLLPEKKTYKPNNRDLNGVGSIPVGGNSPLIGGSVV